MLTVCHKIWAARTLLMMLLLLMEKMKTAVQIFPFIIFLFLLPRNVLLFLLLFFLFIRSFSIFPREEPWSKNRNENIYIVENEKR